MATVSPTSRASPDPRDGRIAELEEQVHEREAQIERLRQELAELKARLAELERAGKRQATPFARQKHKAQRKRSGRQAGQGSFSYRLTPTPTEVQATKTEPLCQCPECGGQLTEKKTHEQFEVELPEIQPTITRYVTESGYCAQCRKRQRSRHPDQISEATGAAGVVVGPRAKALAADLKHRLGVSYAKIEDLFHTAFGLKFSRGGLWQADQRLADQARPIYEELLEVIRQSASVHVDETGWRIGLLAAWLWVFTNRRLTIYTIRTRRGHEVVIEILGREFAGILVSDCFTAYDHQALMDWLKQKCLGHLLKDLSAMRAAKTRGAVRFAQDVTAVLRAALALRAQKATLAPHQFAQQAAQLERELDTLIDVHRRLTDPDNLRFAKRLRKHRTHLLRFLYLDDLDATNNQAERMLRPAVITRKTGGCNRTESGAEAHAILASVLVTCRQQALSLLDFMIKLQRATGDSQPALLPP
jgi:transposase